MLENNLCIINSSVIKTTRPYKKTYSRPTIDTILIDRSISLIMMSSNLGNGNGQGGGWGPGGKPKGRVQSENVPLTDNPFAANPFSDD